MPGWQNDIAYMDNIDLSGSIVPALANGLFTDGDIWIGSTLTNAGGTHVNVGKIISSDGSILVNFVSPNIDIRTASTPGGDGTFIVYDDFIGSNFGGAELSTDIGWTSPAGASGNQVSLSGAEAGHPGVAQIYCNSNADEAIMTGSTLGSAAGLILGGGVMTYSTVVHLSVLGVLNQDYNCFLGIGNLSDAGNEVTNGVYFHYTRLVNSGNWTCKTASGGSRNSINSAVAASTNWVKLAFTINAAASSIEFFINGVSVGTQTATIPTTNIGFFYQMSNISGANDKSIYTDLLTFNQVLTTPR